MYFAFAALSVLLWLVLMHGGVSCCPGNSLPDDISCLAADRMLVFAAAGTVISAFARNKEVSVEKKKESFSFIILINQINNLTEKRNKQ